MSLADLHDLTVVYDRLLAIGTIDETPEGPSHNVVLHSTDGLTWTPIEVPGSEPIVTDLAATSDGLLAGGSVMDHGERRGNLWTSLDGLSWTSKPAPPFAEVAQIVSAEAPRIITDSGRQPDVWVNVADDDWTTARRVNDFSIARGPGGFLMWRGGGQDETRPTRLLHSADATDFQEVELPAALTEGDDALAGVSVFALADRWVLVPSEVKLPDTIYTSTDGLTWEEAPRPAGMTEDRSLDRERRRRSPGLRLRHTRGGRPERARSHADRTLGVAARRGGPGGCCPRSGGRRHDRRPGRVR